jgi:hypothetical protein
LPMRGLFRLARPLGEYPAGYDGGHRCMLVTNWVTARKHEMPT